MAFQKGKSKTGGRKPGSTNIIGKDLRGRVLDIVERNLEGLEGTLEQMEPRDKVAVLLKLMEFILPRGKEYTHKREEFDFSSIPLENRIAALKVLEGEN